MSWQKSLSQFEQIGNAVPPRLAELMGECILKMLNGEAEPCVPNETYEQLSFLDPLPAQEEKKVRGKSHTNRGRNSKYDEIYDEIENLSPGAKYLSSFDKSHEIFMFLEGAMRRRNIQYSLEESIDGNMVLVRH